MTGPGSLHLYDGWQNLYIIAKNPRPRVKGGLMSSKNTGADVISRVIVTKKELPLSCPMPSMSLWNMHPKVFIPVEEKGQAQCPYCGTIYVFEEEE